MVQYSFTSTETRRLVRTDSPGRPPRLSHSSWTMILHNNSNCLYNYILTANHGRTDGVTLRSLATLTGRWTAQTKFYPWRKTNRDYIYRQTGAGVAQWRELPSLDRKVSGSIPGREGWWFYFFWFFLNLQGQLSVLILISVSIPSPPTSSHPTPIWRKVSRRSCGDSNPRPFNHESGALTTELFPLPLSAFFSFFFLPIDIEAAPV